MLRLNWTKYIKIIAMAQDGCVASHLKDITYLILLFFLEIATKKMSGQMNLFKKGVNCSSVNANNTDSNAIKDDAQEGHISPNG